MGVSKEERGIGMVLAGWFSAGVLLLLEALKSYAPKKSSSITSLPPSLPPRRLCGLVTKNLP